MDDVCEADDADVGGGEGRSRVEKTRGCGSGRGMSLAGRNGPRETSGDRLGR